MQGSSPRRMRAKTLLRSYAKLLSVGLVLPVAAASQQEAAAETRLQRRVKSGNREAAVIVPRVVEIVIEGQQPRPQPLSDIPVVELARSVPGRRSRQPGVVGQPHALQIGADGAGPVDPDPIRR